METKVLEKKPQAISQKVELVNGVFTASETADLINNLIDEKINFHKIQRLQRWEGNHNCDTGDLNSRIAELEQEREKTTAFISKLRQSGKAFRILGRLEIIPVASEIL
jgi:hypothetical protein